MDKKNNNFISKHPIIFNLLLIVVVGFALLWGSLLWVDSWTGHGEYRIVPDVKGLPYSRAAEILEEEDLIGEITDSVYDGSVAPGTVLVQTPKDSSKVKPNRKVYLTIASFSTKKVSVPNLLDVSLRQAQSILEGLGLTDIRIVNVPSEYKDLVVGVKFNGVPLNAGTRIPLTATVTLEVGEGIGETGDSITDDVSAEPSVLETVDDFGMF